MKKLMIIVCISALLIAFGCAPKKPKEEGIKHEEIKERYDEAMDKADKDWEKNEKSQ